MTLRRWGGYALLAGMAWCLAHYFVRPGMDQYRQSVASAEVANASNGPGSGLQLTWYGTATVAVSDGTTTLLLDPFFSRSGGGLMQLLNMPAKPEAAVVSAWLGEKAVPGGIDAMLVSHSHYDHLLDVGVVGELTGARLYGGESTVNVGLGHGLPAAQVQLAEPMREISIGDFKATFIPWSHGGTGGHPKGVTDKPLPRDARYLAYKLGDVYAIHLQHPLGSLLHIGSAGKPAVNNVPPAETVLLSLAMREPLNELIATDGSVKTVVPIHWDDFFQPLSKPLRPLPFGVSLGQFYHDMAAQFPAVNVLSLQPGNQVTLQQ